MPLNLNTINNIEDAKKAKYGNPPAALTDDNEKGIFSSPKLNGADGKTDVTKLKAAAKLLDLVKRADKLTKKDIVVLGELEEEKKNNTTAFELINGIDKKVEKVITKVKGLGMDGDDPQVKKEQGKLVEIQGAIKDEEVKKNKLNENLDEILERNYKDVIAKEKAEQKIEAFQKLLVELKTDSVGGTILKFIEKQAENYVKQSEYTDPSLSEFNIDGEKVYLEGTSDQSKTYFFIEVLKEIDGNELKKSLGETSDAYKAYERIMKVKFGI